MLLISDATKLPDIYSRNATKSKHYITGAFGKDESVLNMQDAATHAKFRRMIAPPYSFTNVKRMEYLIDEQISHWIDKIDVLFASGANRVPFDFAQWAVYMAYDIISSIGFGAPIGFIEQGGDTNGLVNSVRTGMWHFGIMAKLYPFVELVKKTFLARYLVSTPEQKSGMGTLMRFRDRLIEKRYEDIKGGATASRYDLLQT